MTTPHRLQATARTWGTFCQRLNKWPRWPTSTRLAGKGGELLKIRDGVVEFWLKLKPVVLNAWFFLTDLPVDNFSPAIFTHALAQKAFSCFVSEKDLDQE